MSHPRFYGGLLLTSVACGSARLLNYLLCPLSSLHWLCFLTMEIKKSLWGCSWWYALKGKWRRWKDEKNLAMGRKKKCWDKGDKDVSWGRNEIKKKSATAGKAVTAVPPWSWPPYEEMEEECRWNGKGLEIGLWLHSPQRKIHSGNCYVHKNNEGVYIIHLWARNTLEQLGWRERKEEAENQSSEENRVSVCVLVQAPQQRQEYEVYLNTEWGQFVWFSRLQRSFLRVRTWF